jgi:DNA processing protein
MEKKPLERERRGATEGVLKPPISVEGIPVRTVSPEELLGPLTTLELKFAPSKLYLAGKYVLPLLHPRVAIVGTREPSEEGRDAAAAIATELAEHGVSVVSGLARGIDTAAHTAAIRAGGYTIAVLGTPLSKVNPPSNAALQRQIMVSHLALTQFGPEDPVFPANFVVRNRTMALIADASVIVESGDTGGSLSQGWETLRLGHPLFVHEREFSKSSVNWPAKMAQYGAIRFREPADILESLPTPSPGPDLALVALQPA